MGFNGWELPKWVQDPLCLFSQFAQGPVLWEGVKLGQAQPAFPGSGGEQWRVDPHHVDTTLGYQLGAGAVALSMSSNQKQSEEYQV